MMDTLRTWLLGVVLTAFASGVAHQIVPEKSERSVVRLVSGLLMVIALLQPISKMRWTEGTVAAGNFYAEVRRRADAYTETGQNELGAIIAEKTASYIWDKATELGIDCRVTVDVAATEGGVPLPDSVTISAPRSEALAKWLEEVVGIPAEKQIWQEGST